MDPTTTLVTFLMETHPSVQSLHLIGSWDNFTTSYSMERDSRRGRGQWRGCHSFRDIISENEAPPTSRTSRRNGGLRMGHTYYYYYEVDGATETYDPAQPSTTTCPYLPGQTVNTMNVPYERASRYRSASVNSVHQSNFMTMDPASKFTTPRPAPAPPILSESTAAAAPQQQPQQQQQPAPTHCRIGSAPTLLQRKRSSRSMSPAPTHAWKRLFSRRMSSRDSLRHSLRESDDSRGSSPVIMDDDSGRGTPPEGVRSRDMSPEGLRRFLSDDMPLRPASNLDDRPTVIIPADIVEENEDDEDDDYRDCPQSATSESYPFPTILSPPPRSKLRPTTSETAPLSMANSSALTLIPAKLTSSPEPQEISAPADGVHSDEVSPKTPYIPTSNDGEASSSYTSNASSLVASPISAQSPEEMTSFYDSNDDEEEDDLLSNNDDEVSVFQSLSTRPRQTGTFEGYSLPQQSCDASESKVPASDPSAFTHVSSSGTEMSNERSVFLDAPIDTGLDDFATELGWMVHSIGNETR